WGLMTYLEHRSAGLAAEPPITRAQAPAAFDSARAWGHLNELVSIGPRPAGSPGLRQTRAYITRQMATLGLTVQEQTFTAPTPQGPVEMSNLVVRLPGRRADKILITGHYDTKPLRGITFVGANDGGSSAAFLIELARAVKDLPREFTWELVWFDGEEAFCLNWDDCRTPDGGPDNTYGSRHYVKAAQEAGQIGSIRAMILVDMIAERGARFPRESYSTAWLKDIIWGAAGQLGHAATFPDREYGQIEDDHVPFLEAGVPSVDIIDIDYPAWHTAADTIDKLSAQSLQIVGDVLIASLPRIEQHLQR
ncbi:MAG TPA: M28 family peptidase, partial [Vicinamibacterales bacterium]|nr:M28 family peptidase [Vicinamibacterales bacterium]